MNAGISKGFAEPFFPVALQRAFGALKQAGLLQENWRITLMLFRVHILFSRLLSPVHSFSNEAAAKMHYKNKMWS